MLPNRRPFFECSLQHNLPLFYPAYVFCTTAAMIEPSKTQPTRSAPGSGPIKVRGLETRKYFVKHNGLIRNLTILYFWLHQIKAFFPIINFTSQSLRFKMRILVIELQGIKLSYFLDKAELCI